MLQLTAVEDDLGRFDIIEETLRATNLGKLEEGSSVNFERFVPAVPSKAAGHHSLKARRRLTPGCCWRGEESNQVALHRRSARVGDEIGGHNVSGHVHTTAEVSEIKETENNTRITLKVGSPCGFLRLKMVF